MRVEKYQDGQLTYYTEIKKVGLDYIFDDNGVESLASPEQILEYDEWYAFVNQQSQQEIVANAATALVEAAETLTHSDINSIAELKTTVRPALEAAAEALTTLVSKM